MHDSIYRLHQSVDEAAYMVHSLHIDHGHDRAVVTSPVSYKTTSEHDNT